MLILALLVTVCNIEALNARDIYANVEVRPFLFTNQRQHQQNDNKWSQMPSNFFDQHQPKPYNQPQKKANSLVKLQDEARIPRGPMIEHSLPVRPVYAGYDGNPTNHFRPHGEYRSRGVYGAVSDRHARPTNRRPALSYRSSA